MEHPKLSPKLVSILIIFFVILFIAIIYIVYFSSSLNNSQNISSNSSQLIIDNEDKYCEVDSDCILITSSCGSCSFEVVNTNSKKKYSEILNNYCRKNPPEIACDLEFTGDIECENSKCVINS